MAEQQQKKIVTQLIGVLLALIIVWYFFGGGLERQASTEMKKIEQQVAIDALKQYVIAKRHGSAMDACVQAGFVTAAFLQANDEENYRQWKQIEVDDCKRAGL